MKEAGSDRLYHVALETDDAIGMRNYLAAHGVKVPWRKLASGRIGNLNYFIQVDPNGRNVEIVQYATDGWTCCSTRANSCPTRASPRT